MPNDNAARVLHVSVVDAPLEPAPIPAQDIVSGAPEAFVTLLWRNEEGTLFNGVWHCTPGTFYLDHPDETVAFIEGRATVTPEGGEPVELTAGDAGFFPNGTRVLWEVHETVRKAFHNHDPNGRLLAGG
ncbi:cupin domain-containing protein [Conexibacter woesei]|uniref:(S)-ureidoglycine aminohydrolase cupin domain-containing protein n=1 Tax=Conexibacter woesei (strain DSM 14684 / CCUG 47730 / CIP 108061 / JCM 11494 / NBRC 100937 / ID131577) TaxID=469383 RepID=D3F9A2_CONWI|nr:cupin domain-containing protein [Conexibacter woesei]ADB49069.1 protein of unknown function DUF861 cupin_3 [Conexibacter woesei DSM 14684]